MTFANAGRIAFLASIVYLLAAVGIATASAQGPIATASAGSAAHICSKRAERVTRSTASASAASSQRRAAVRRCMVRLRHTAAYRQRDLTAPTVTWQAPSAGATVKGSLAGSSCLAGAADDRGVYKVVFKVDGATLNTESDAPYNCSFDSTRVADGSHTLTATAYDVAGNSGSASIAVTVSNASAPAPAPAPSPAPAAPAPAPAPTGDVSAPTVAWQVPSAGATIKGKLQGSSCEVSATDDRGIDRVVFKIDGTPLNTESDAPWNCILDTTKVADGAHTVTTTAYDAAGNSSSAARSFTVSNGAAASAPAPEPAPAPAPSSGHLVIGIDGGYGGWSSTETGYRAQLGVAVTRHEWDPSQPVNHQDALVLKAASQVHTRIHAQLGGNELGDPTHYRDWVVAFIRRYGLGGSFWKEHPELDESSYAMTTFELGNEPYFGDMSAAEYADAVQPALEEVQRLGLPAKIVLVSRVYGTDTSWMDTLYQRIPNLNSLFYAFADHPYWYGHDPAEGTAAGPFGRIGVLRRRMNEKGASAKPIFITEYGESTANCGGECVSESVQAEHLQAMIAAAITRTEWKIEMVSVYQLLDRGTNSSERELQFGLLRQNGTPKPAYSIVRQLGQEYRG